MKITWSPIWIPRLDEIMTSSKKRILCQCRFIISQLGDSNEHHKRKFYGELIDYVFWLS